MDVWKDQNGRDEVLEAFSKMRADKVLCDFIIHFDGQDIPVHRVVLAASSKVLEQHLAGDSSENDTGRIEFEGIEFETGKQCVDFMYTGTAELSTENPEKLIHAAETIGIPALSDMYLKFLKEKVGVGVCVKYIKLAKEYGNRRSFKELLLNFSGEDLGEIIASDNFGDIEFSVLRDLVSAISTLGRNFENLKWEAIVNWVNNIPTERRKDFRELFEMVTLENLSGDFLSRHIGQNNLVREHGECMKRAFKATCSVEEAKRRREEPQTHILKIRDDSRIILEYSPETERWSRLAISPVDVSTNSDDMVKHNDEIYVCKDGNLHKYSDGQWSVVHKAERPTSFCRCSVCKCFVVMVTSSSIVKYNTETKDVEIIDAQLGFDRFAIAASNDFLYAVQSSREESQAKEFYIQGKSWRAIANMNKCREDGGLVFERGKMFALGGTHGRQVVKYNQRRRSHYYEGAEDATVVECYDPSIDQWRTLPTDIQYQNSSFKAFIKDGTVYTIGGRNGNKIVKVVLP